ncbi:MAG: hypothetical protein AB1894_07725 [Chloroflexota bacterium]
MKLFSTRTRNRTARQAMILAVILLAALALSTIYPLVHAHAQQCMDCVGGGDPPPDPPDDDGGDGDEPDSGDDDDPSDDPDDPPCVPYFSPPSISARLVLAPPYPITLGQDPDDRGVDVSGITARGGMHYCPNSGPARIIALRVTRVQLAQSSIAWITGTLARKYPGAHVKGSYPFIPPYSVSGIGSSRAQLSFHLAPLDPGYYEVSVTATQQDGQSASATLRVPVYLMESSIIE